MQVIAWEAEEGRSEAKQSGLHETLSQKQIKIKKPVAGRSEALEEPIQSKIIFFRCNYIYYYSNYLKLKGHRNLRT